MENKELRELIEQAHMAGQINENCKEPSYSEARTYCNEVVKDFALGAVVGSILDLPERVQGKGDRADFYKWFDKDCTVIILNNEEFNKLVYHNSKRLEGDETDIFFIINEGEKEIMAIREGKLV